MPSEDAREGRRAGERSRTQLTAEPFLPHEASLTAARRAAAVCKGCNLWRAATQTVFGEGPRAARLMLIGETPGDQEDLAGRPFVGSAGRLLDRALEAAGIDRPAAYVTNAVKHFKWEARGKRRLHRRPDAEEIRACFPWVRTEIELVRPRIIVCLGATAGRALLGPSFRVSRDRGRFVESPLAPFVTATIHPSALLRIRERPEREAALAAFVADLRLAQSAIK